MGPNHVVDAFSPWKKKNNIACAQPFDILNTAKQYHRQLRMIAWRTSWGEGYCFEDVIYQWLCCIFYEFSDSCSLSLINDLISQKETIKSILDQFMYFMPLQIGSKELQDCFKSRLSLVHIFMFFVVLFHM